MKRLKENVGELISSSPLTTTDINNLINEGKELEVNFSNDRTNATMKMYKEGSIIISNMKYTPK